LGKPKNPFKRSGKKGKRTGALKNFGAIIYLGLLFLVIFIFFAAAQAAITADPFLNFLMTWNGMFTYWEVVRGYMLLFFLVIILLIALKDVGKAMKRRMR
jgi:hypothetical protein